MKDVLVVFGYVRNSNLILEEGISVYDMDVVFYNCYLSFFKFVVW